MTESSGFSPGDIMFPMQRVSNEKLAILERFSDSDVQEMCADLHDLRRLSEKLMSDVASLLQLYKTATHEHPDDDMRIFTIGNAEAAIVSARWCLYGQTTDGRTPSGLRKG